MKPALRLIILIIALLAINSYSMAQSVTVTSDSRRITLTKVAESELNINRIIEGEDYLSVCAYDGKIHLFNYMESGSLVEEAVISIQTFPFYSIQRDSILYVADRDSGFITYDISDLQYPVELDRYYARYIEMMGIDGDYAYLFPRQESNMTILNISDPAEILFEGKADSSFGAMSMQIRDNYIYIGRFQRPMTIVDISDPVHPVITAAIEPEFGTGLREVDEVLLNGNYAYVCNNVSLYWYPPHYIEIFVIDISDVYEPAVITSYRTPVDADTYHGGLAISGDFLFAGMGRYNLNVFDISDPDTLVHLKQITEYADHVEKLVIRGDYLFMGTHLRGMGTKPYGLQVLRIDDVTGVDDEEQNNIIPTAFTLHQNYPNPFNPQTTIRFEMPKSGHVTLTIYNVLGQEVAKLVDNQMAAGIHEITWKASSIPSGTYFCRITAGDNTYTRKMLLLK